MVEDVIVQEQLSLRPDVQEGDLVVGRKIRIPSFHRPLSRQRVLYFALQIQRLRQALFFRYTDHCSPPFQTFDADFGVFPYWMPSRAVFHSQQWAERLARGLDGDDIGGDRTLLADQSDTTTSQRPTLILDIEKQFSLYPPLEARSCDLDG